MSRFGHRPAEDLPDVGPVFPALALRAVGVILAAALTIVAFGLDGWLAVGLLLAIAAAYMPENLVGWLLILFLAAGQLTRHAGLSWQLLVLLAGLHLLHVVASLTLEIPERSWVQLGVLRAPLLRWAAIQVPAQAFAVVVLLLLSPDHNGHRPVTIAGSAVIGALALIALATVLFGRRDASPAGGDGPQRG